MLMKYVFMIIATAINFSGLTAMAPDEWHEIYKKPEEKQQLMTVYKDFCQKRIKDSAAWTVGSLTPFLFKTVRKFVEPKLLVSIFGLRQGYLLGRNLYRNSLAQQGNLSYLNKDVLEQLGNPDVTQKKYQFEVVYYDKTGDYSEQKGNLSVDSISGIEQALSGRYKEKESFQRERIGVRLPFEIERTAGRVIKNINDKTE
jgi:hypothetical protein